MFDASPRPELLALLATVKAEPEDETVKLVLADWLQEQDHAADRARGAYLRALLACDRLAPDDPGRRFALANLQSLWRNYPAWLGALPAAGFKFWAYAARWGLLFPGVDGAQLMSKKAAAVAGSEEYAWVGGLALGRLTSHQNQRFVRSRLIETLIALRYDACGIETSAVSDLATAPGAVGLKHLEFSDMSSIPFAGSMLAASPYLTNLRHLSFRKVQLGDAGFRAICTAPDLRQLQSLEVVDDGLSIHAARAFADDTDLPALIELNLTGNRIGPDGALVLVHTPTSGRLQKLNLASNGIADYGVDVICRCVHIHRLTHLNLSRNLLTDRSAVAFAAAGQLKALEALNLRGNAISDIGARALAEAPHLGNLCRLDLTANPVGPRAAAVLRDRFGNGVVVS